MLLLLVFGIIGAGCSQKQNSQPVDPGSLNGGFISVKGTGFIDSNGRQVIFNGINYVNKDPKINYIPKDSAATFTRFKNMGFNCIRLGVIWDGVEPEPGKYDEKYLDKIEEQVKWATQNGIYVMLDMHQDLYGVSFGEGTSALGDGAPNWATLTDGQPHVKGFIWSDSYFMSGAVQRAFDNFWANTPVSDGIGVQDHYAKMWQHVAKRFANNPTVIGYDIMNEPFNGSQGNLILPVILTEYAKLMAEETGKILSEQEVMGIWMNEESRLEALKNLQNKEKYARVIKAATEQSQQFEKIDLHNMYQRVGLAIREIDTTHILFLEHAYFSNTGIASGVERVNLKNGKPDWKVAYAAHGYDLLVDTKVNDAQSSDRVEFIFSQINEASKRANLPVLVGEWGAFSGDSDGNTSSARFIRGLFDRFLFGHTYWAYYPGIEKHGYFSQTFSRPYAQFTGGSLQSVSYNYETGVFTCSWEESPAIKEPTVIYIPELKSLNKESIKLNPENNNTIIQSIENSGAAYLIIPVSGQKEIKSLEFRNELNQAMISIDKP
jgi:endoglycosylceramidase